MGYFLFIFNFLLESEWLLNKMNVNSVRAWIEFMGDKFL